MFNHVISNLPLTFCLNSPQELDSPEPEHEDGPSIELVPTAPVLLFGKHKPPLSKVLLQSQQSKSSSKASAKRKEAPVATEKSPVADAPQVKARKTTIKKNRPAALPTPSDPETSTDKQVQVLYIFLLHIA